MTHCPLPGEDRLRNPLKMACCCINRLRHDSLHQIEMMQLMHLSHKGRASNAQKSRTTPFSGHKHQTPVLCERRPISSSIPPICGSRANKMRRTIAKSSGTGRIMPPEIHATNLIAASVWWSASRTLVIAASRSWRRSATKGLAFAAELPQAAFAFPVPDGDGVR